MFPPVWHDNIRGLQVAKRKSWLWVCCRAQEETPRQQSGMKINVFPSNVFNLLLTFSRDKDQLIIKMCRMIMRQNIMRIKSVFRQEILTDWLTGLRARTVCAMWIGVWFPCHLSAVSRPGSALSLTSVVRVCNDQGRSAATSWVLQAAHCTPAWPLGLVRL